MKQNFAQTPAVVLASASPRRRELLAQLGVSFTVAPADIDESVAPGEAPAEYVARMAREKALTASQAADLAEEGAWVVIGADTSVVVDEHILGKPQDKQHAMRMLAQLSGRTHQVMSAVAMTDGQRLEVITSITDVSFRSITASEAAAYWDTGEPRDKAGAYGIQGLGALFVSHLAGSYTGVVGLPLFETAELLARLGCPIDLEPA